MEKYINKYGLVVVLILALALRLASLDQSLWLDEATSAILARDFTYREIISKFSPGDFHPPFYYILLKVWSTFSGFSEVGLRMLSVLLGLLNIYVVYLIAKITTKSKFVALLSSILLATSGLHIYYSQEARMYAAQTLFVSLAFLFFILTQAKEDIKYWLGFSMSLVLIGATDYLPLFALPVFWIYSLISRKKKMWWKKFLVAQIPLLLFFIFWASVFIQQFNLGLGVEGSAPVWWDVLGKTSLKNTLLLPIKFVIGRISFEDSRLYALTALLALAPFVACLAKSAKRLRKDLIIWLWFAVPVVIAFVAGFQLSVFSYFRLIFVLPAFYLLVSIGVFSFKKNSRVVLAILLVIINISTSIYYLSNYKFHREDWRNLVTYIDKESEKSETITLFVADSQMEVYKYYSQDGNYAGPGAFSGKYEIIWLMRYVQPIFDPEDALRFKIEDEGYERTGEYDFNGVVVWKYKK